MAEIFDLTGSRPRTGIPRIGTAAASALPTVPVVVAGAHSAAARLGRTRASKVGPALPGWSSCR